jgi:hypothetical protein
LAKEASHSGLNGNDSRPPSMTLDITKEWVSIGAINLPALLLILVAFAAVMWRQRKQAYV